MWILSINWVLNNNDGIKIPIFESKKQGVK